jgi:hypothetical protein
MGFTTVARTAHSFFVCHGTLYSISKFQIPRSKFQINSRIQIPNLLPTSC